MRKKLCSPFCGERADCLCILDFCGERERAVLVLFFLLNSSLLFNVKCNIETQGFNNWLL